MTHDRTGAAMIAALAVAAVILFAAMLLFAWPPP